MAVYVDGESRPTHKNTRDHPQRMLKFPPANAPMQRPHELVTGTTLGVSTLTEVYRAI